MSLSAISPQKSSSRARVWRVLAIAGVSLLLIAAAGLVWLLTIARAALPQLDGPLPVAGISAPVSVTRDSHGVPTIEATTLIDLFFAQGFVTAQDRLFQIDLLRRAAAGELAEVFGDIALEHDRRQRILGLRATAEAGVQTATAEDSEYFGAYARGVNAYIASHRNSLPVEFRLLGYSPSPWRAQDSLVIAYQMVETLSTPPAAALVREKILARLGPELTGDLYVNKSWRDHPPGVDSGGNDMPEQHRSPASGALALAQAASTLDPLLYPFFSHPTHALGSNNWVVSGEHTVTGKPLLSNDMHLGHRMPNLWYEAHLHSEDFDVAGVTLPGYPYVIVGHNARIAWGFTNVGPTIQDAYVETYDDHGQYFTPDGWKKPQIRQEVIHVKGKPDVVLDVEVTRHGPIVSQLSAGQTRKVALRWTLYDGIRNPFFQLNSAQNWQQFRRALSSFDAPGQNVVYADVDGNIGYQTTGKVPIRASGDGCLPEDGSNNAHEWIGYIPFERLPSVFNPPSGIIATANGRITPENYPYSISCEWEAPWRTERIYHSLGSGRQLSAADMLALQIDIYSELDHFIAEKLVSAAGKAKTVTPRARAAAEILQQWNGHMDASSSAPTIASAARTELKRMLLEPKLGPAPGDEHSNAFSWKSYHWLMETVWLENVLSQQPSRWLPSQYASYDDLLAAALDKAVSNAPADLNSWKWGPANSLTIQNSVLGRIPLLRRWTGPGTQPQSGSDYTVKASGRDYGPSERFTADLANLDASSLNTVTGQSGNFLSPYYMDQWQAWHTGFTFTLPFSSSAVKSAATHRLILQPK